jgi:glycosyltransferase involved in cell wall biosynthesis
MKIAIRQVRGNSGTDVWADSLCRGLLRAEHECSVDLLSKVFQFAPVLARLSLDLPSCDIIQGNSWNAATFKGETPLVVTDHLVVHDPAYDSYRTLPQKIYHRWIYRCEQQSLDAADAVVCVSEDTRDKLEATFGYSDASVIHNGVDIDLFKPVEVNRKTWNVPENKTVLFFAGNLSRRKGADLLPAILKELGEGFILLTTSGNRVQSQNNIPHSRDLGYLNLQMLIDMYNLCDIFLLPSRLEGLSLSTLEAMACAKPVVAFNCSSFPELILDGKGGFLSEKDNVLKMVDSIRYLAEDRSVREKMGKYNRERILDRFTLERMVADYIRVYQSLSD